jgi:AraC family transcriptional regulator of adaptative response/methylated-DNA-[protein]-cysteine methyltransferase
MTFQAYQRARRVAAALPSLRNGSRVGALADASGFESESGFRAAFTQLFGAAPTQIAGDANVLHAQRIATPIGPMLAIADDQGVLLLEFVDRRALATQIATLRRRASGPIVPGDNAHLRRLADELERYFAGDLRAFDLELVARGTPFQERVWAELRRIPCGETRSYADVARAIGHPSAVRAVAHANGMNRIAILIPCHRVIGSDGSPTGYAGGLWRKTWLLDHERGQARNA